MFSVPSQRVLCCDWSRNVGRTTRGVHVAPATAVAITSTARHFSARHGSIVGKFAAHQCTAHHSRAASLAHRGVGDGARSVARQSLPLVPPSNKEHGSTIGTSQSTSSNSNTHSLGLLVRRSARGRRIGKGTAVTTASRRRGAAAGPRGA